MTAVTVAREPASQSLTGEDENDQECGEAF